MQHKYLKGMKWVGDLSLADAETLVKFGITSKRILEFGMGGSTQLLAQCNPTELISLDTSEEWINITSSKLKQITSSASISLLNYSELTNIVNNQSKSFDLIFVDGIDSLRLEFALTTWKLLDTDGVMIFHDTRRQQDINNVLNVVSTNFTEVETVELNIRDSLNVSSNMSVIYKKISEPYVNWNNEEGKPLSAYHGHLTGLDDPLWEYPKNI